MYELKNWCLRVLYGCFVVAWGEVYNNPKFSQGTTIHTSDIDEIRVEEHLERLVIRTQSKSLYICKFSQIDCYELQSTKELSSIYNVPERIIDKCVECTKMRQIKQNK